MNDEHLEQVRETTAQALEEGDVIIGSPQQSANLARGVRALDVRDRAIARLLLAILLDVPETIGTATTMLLVRAAVKADPTAQQWMEPELRADLDEETMDRVERVTDAFLASAGMRKMAEDMMGAGALPFTGQSLN